MATTALPLRVDSRPRLVISAPRPRTFREDLGDVANKLHHGVPDLTPQERQFLKDMKDADRAYPMKPLDRLISLSARAADPVVRGALEGCINAHVTQRVGRASVSQDVWDQEDDANAFADKAVRRYLLNPTVANRLAAREALEAQKAYTQRCLDLINSTGAA